jgi:hypothetical protein
MREKSITKKAQENRATITRKDVQRLFQISRDESQSEEARMWLWGYFDEMASNAARLDYVNVQEIFTRAISEVLSNIEAYNAPYEPTEDDDYQMLKMIVRRVEKGEVLDAIYTEEKEASRARVAEIEEKERNKPEPRNWLSQEWRWWKIRQLTRVIMDGDTDSRMAAGREYRALLRELVADESFYHVDFILSLLPHLLNARQDIARMIGQPKSARCKPGYFKAKRGGARS